VPLIRDHGIFRDDERRKVAEGKQRMEKCRRGYGKGRGQKFAQLQGTETIPKKNVNFPLDFRLKSLSGR